MKTELKLDIDNFNTPLALLNRIEQDVWPLLDDSVLESGRWYWEDMSPASIQAYCMSQIPELEVKHRDYWRFMFHKDTLGQAVAYRFTKVLDITPNDYQRIFGNSALSLEDRHEWLCDVIRGKTKYEQWVRESEESDEPYDWAQPVEEWTPRFKPKSMKIGGHSKAS